MRPARSSCGVFRLRGGRGAVRSGTRLRRGRRCGHLALRHLPLRELALRHLAGLTLWQLTAHAGLAGSAALVPVAITVAITATVVVESLTARDIIVVWSVAIARVAECVAAAEAQRQGKHSRGDASAEDQAAAGRT